MRTISKWLWRVLSVAMVLMMALSPLFVSPSAVVAQGETPPEPEKSADNLVFEDTKAGLEAKSLNTKPTISPEAAWAKIDPDLHDLVASASPSLPTGVGAIEAIPAEPVLVQVMAAPDTDLSEYFVDGKVFARPSLSKGDFHLQMYIGRITPANILKLASLGEVEVIIEVVFEKNASPDNYPIDDEINIAERGPADWETLRLSAEKLRDGSLPWSEAPAFGDGREPAAVEDWFEVKQEGPHKAEAAWARGITGEGVTVAVNDDGIDPAHPDLMGTQKIYSSTVRTEYNGWPMVFSPFSQYLYFNDEYYGSSYISGGYDSSHFVDTSTTPTLSNCGIGLRCFSFTPHIDYATPGYNHTYVMNASWTKSGVVHVGTHPDYDLRDFVWGELPAVLVVDPNTAGVYDTVVIDLDNDYDFRDEKLLTKADVHDPMTYNNMISYRDMNGDGIADLSGGMVYFIADGVHTIPASDYMWEATCGAGAFMCPGNGDLVAIAGSSFGYAYSHGTQCASVVVGQGVVQNASLGLDNSFLPTFSDIASADGKPSAAVYGMAPGAKIVNVSDIYWNHVPSTIDAYLFNAVGYDAVDQTGYDLLLNTTGHTDSDPIQINSNSYGASATDWDGWEYRGQVVSQLQRLWAPNTQYMFSTGNGAPGYGTAAPPSPETAIAVGASTEYGSTGWDTITETVQINYNDVVAFSNSGPGAREGSGADVLAGGAYAAGDEELNYYSTSTWGVLDGNLSWDSWGGTSRSAPVAMGVLALIYQAFYDNQGRWPTYAEAKSLLMSTATDVNANVFRQGAGSVNADYGTLAASGEYGVYMADDSSDWQPGDYDGMDYPGFAHVVEAGETYHKTFTVTNDSAAPVDVSIADSTLTLIDSVDFDFTVTEDMVNAENADNFYKAFQYFIPITATASADAMMHNIVVPADTELMVVRQRFPFDEFDVNGDYAWDNRFYLMVYNWMDVNGDGDVWEDKDANGVVNFINASTVTQIDGGTDLVWDDPITELDQWEYARFGYNRPSANTNELMVSNPLQRMHDGLFIGLRHLSTTVNDVHLSYRIEFYKKADVPWLSANKASMTVPAGGTANFVGTVAPAADMAGGDYEAAFYVSAPGDATYPGNDMVIPVVMNVVETLDAGNTTLTFGGADVYAADSDKPYNNAAVRGYQEWGWRAESGDWRMFYMDIDTTGLDPTSHVIIRDVWADAAPHTDIDTIVLGPSPTELPNAWYGSSEPSYYGPYSLRTVGGSQNTNVGAGTWLFNTTSGTNEEWVAFEIQDGLHRLLQHNVMFEGDQFDAVFTKTVGILSESEHSFEVETYQDAGQIGSVVLTSTLDLNGLIMDAYVGLGDTIEFVDEPIPFVSSNTIEWTTVFTIENGVSLDLTSSSADISDIDLFLYYWNGAAWELRGSSETGTANEHIRIETPEDGSWLAGINNYSGPAGHFNLTIERATRSPGITISGVPTGAVAANTPVAIDITYDFPMEQGKTYQAVVTLGPPEAPTLKQIPITITRKVDSAAVTKVVDLPTAFAGDTVVYSLDLYNLNDSNAEFSLSDPLPEQMEFVGITGGVIPTTCLLEGFEENWPPTEWQVVVNTGAGWNTNTYWGTGNYTPGADGQSASADADSFRSGMDTELWSPVIDLTAATEATLMFDSNFQDFAGNGDAYVDVSTNMGSSWTNVWTTSVDEPPEGITHTLDLSGYTGNSVIVRWHFITPDWDWFWQIDDVLMTSDNCRPAAAPAYGTLVYDPMDHTLTYDGGLPLSMDMSTPAASFDVTVVVSDTVMPGDYLTNTAYLDASHPVGGNGPNPASEYTKEDAAVVHIGIEDFMTSYKDAPPEANPAGLVQYDIHVINSGDALAAIDMVDPIPAGTTFFDIENYPPPNFDYDAMLDAVVWSGNVAPGEELVFTFWVEADAGLTPGEMITNTATLSWNDATMDLYAESEVTEPDVMIEKSGLPAEPIPGDVITFTVDYVNNGSGTAYDAVITDTLPAGLSTNSPLLWDIGDIGPGITGTLSYTATVDTNFTTTTELTNVAAVSYSNDFADLTPADNSFAYVFAVKVWRYLYMPTIFK